MPQKVRQNKRRTKSCAAWDPLGEGGGSYIKRDSKKEVGWEEKLQRHEAFTVGPEKRSEKEVYLAGK